MKTYTVLLAICSLFLCACSNASGWEVCEDLEPAPSEAFEVVEVLDVTVPGKLHGTAAQCPEGSRIVTGECTVEGDVTLVLTGGGNIAQGWTCLAQMNAQEPGKVTATAECIPNPEPSTVNGACSAALDCAPSDFCLREWCDGPTCRPIDRCFPRSPAGDLCELGGDQCVQGLECVPDGDPDHTALGVCS